MPSPSSSNNNHSTHRRRGRRTLTSLSEINVVPLVDVMLVMLVIFMVTAPFMQMGIEVDLPKAQAQSLDPDENNMILSVNADRKIFLGDTEIPREVLKEKLLQYYNYPKNY